MSYLLHLCESHNPIDAADVVRAIGFRPTCRTVLGGIPATTQGVKLAADLDSCRAAGQWPVVWGYDSPEKYGTGVYKLTDLAQLDAHGKKLGAALKAHEDKGGQAGAVSILAELNDGWQDKEKFIKAFETVAQHIPAGWVRIWALSTLMPLTGAQPYRPPSAQALGIHPYGLKSFRAGTAQNARLVSYTVMAQTLGLRLCAPEAGIIDLADIANAGKRPWHEYLKRLLAWGYENKALFASFVSDDFKGFGSWLDGRWAASLPVDEGKVAWPQANPALFGWPGAPATMTLAKDQLSSPEVAKLATSPFVVASEPVGPVTAID